MTYRLVCMYGYVWYDTMIRMIPDLMYDDFYSQDAISVYGVAIIHAPPHNPLHSPHPLESTGIFLMLFILHDLFMQWQAPTAHPAHPVSTIHPPCTPSKPSLNPPHPSTRSTPQLVVASPTLRYNCVFADPSSVLYNISNELL